MADADDRGLPVPDGLASAVGNQISGGVFFHAVIQGHTVAVHLPPEVLPALAGLPTASPGFTGRDRELDLLLGLLDPGIDDTPTVCSVVGLAGVGKTELAIQAAHAARKRGWYPGGVLFADLQGYDDERRVEPANALHGLLQALGVRSEHIPSQLQDRARLYRSVLAAFAEQGQPILVLVDNASSAEHARPLLPADRRTRAIVTSRHTLSTLDSRLLGLHVLNEQSAFDLLSRLLEVAHGRDARLAQERQAANELARLCGYLPLALRIVGALLVQDPRKPLAVMIEDLSDERARLDALAVDGLAVRAAFDLSYQALSVQAAGLFRILPLSPGPEISTETAAALFGDEPRVCRRLLETLAQAHLVESGTAYGRWRLHDLVRAFATEQMNLHVPEQERGAAVHRLVGHYLDTIRNLRTRPRDARGDEEIQRWLMAEGSNLIATGNLVALAGRPTSAERLISEAISLTDAAFHRAVDRLYWNWFFFHGARRFKEAFEALQQHLVVIQPACSVRLEDAVLERVYATLDEVSTSQEAVRSLEPAVAALNVAGEIYAEGRVLVTLGLALLQEGRPGEACDALRRAIGRFRYGGRTRSPDEVHAQAVLDTVQTATGPLEQDWWSQRSEMGWRRQSRPR
ncbi:NB-ARC domain-containing protein [Streptomyces sp. GC420]|uniref:NB-ARC domain-containing protein n=1 Tax=Streptomyces sp. GC420 TaxID=2697568 RepID=UPI001414D544|nr:NB-ARC domain-containing protein [Streptomyces sp. GC420]NBM17976.1 AAA family ATPase [Streptomyces sp. GC420]